MTPLTPTGRVILGMIALGNQTGYDIKRVVDKSTRHFWSASYGQIYPELRRLEEQGLVQGQSEPTGGRARTVYSLTPAGRAALGDWLEPERDPTFDVRDEGMLRLFFSDFGTPEQRVANLRAMRDAHRGTVEQLEALHAHAADMHTGPRLTLELGLGLHRWMTDWCEQAERQLADAAKEPDGAD